MKQGSGAAYRHFIPGDAAPTKAPTRNSEWLEGDFGDQHDGANSSEGESQTDGAMLLMESSLRDLMDTQTTAITDTGVEPWGNKVAMAVDSSVRELPTRPKIKYQDRGNSAFISKTVPKSRRWLASVDDRFLERPQRIQSGSETDSYNPLGLESVSTHTDSKNPHWANQNHPISGVNDARRGSHTNQSSDNPNRKFMVRNPVGPQWDQPGQPIFRVKLKDFRSDQNLPFAKTKPSNCFYTGSVGLSHQTFDERIFKTQESHSNTENRSFLDLQRTAARQEKSGEAGSHTRILRAALFGYSPPKASIVKPSAHGVLSLEVTGPNSRLVCQSPSRKATAVPSAANKTTTGAGNTQASGTATKLVRRTINLGSRAASRSISRTKEDLIGYGSKIGIFPDQKEARVNLGSSLNLSRPTSQKPVLTSHLQRILARAPDFSFQMSRNREHLIMKKPQASGSPGQPEFLRGKPTL